MKRCLIGKVPADAPEVAAKADDAGETSSIDSRKRHVRRRPVLKDAHAGLASIYGVPSENPLG